MEQLLIAASNGDIAEIDRLLKAGANPDYVDPHIGNSALYNATYRDHVGAVQAILAGGADPNLRLNYRSPIDDREERQVVALMYALSAATAKLLIEGGADVDVADESGVTALLRATYRGHAEVVRVLLDAGANVHQKTKDGHDALRVAEMMITKYRAWDVGPNRALVAEKVARFEQIGAMIRTR